jgi:hypothetical protein
VSKPVAIIELMMEARKERLSTAAARRVTRACKVLGLAPTEVWVVLGWLDYCDPKTGEAYKAANVKRVWP